MGIRNDLLSDVSDKIIQRYETIQKWDFDGPRIHEILSKSNIEQLWTLKNLFERSDTLIELICNDGSTLFIQYGSIFVGIEPDGSSHS